MHSFSIVINNLQHIKKLEFVLNLEANGLVAIIGKNGVGKTMLFKGIQNLVTSNTFAKTSNKYIYQDDSSIIYSIDGREYHYKYNKKIETLDYKDEIDEDIRENIYVELPIPFGNRFNHFERIGKVDDKIRSSLDTKNYSKPDELIDLLNYIYDTERFNNLAEIQHKNENFYAIPLDNNYYIREDYLSSAEYFIISIYKMIQKKCQLIVIDEIDISLDAMAQVRFINKLRELSQEYNIKLLFSTHSLALIKTLDKEKGDKLYYMELQEGIVSFEEKSYNYIKSLLYGFQDYDKYILTEDEVLKEYIKYVLKDEKIFSKYIIIYIGGASNTVDLMRRNESMKIFEDKKNVCTVLDGDCKDKTAYKNETDILFSPFSDIEDYCLECFNNKEFGIYSQEELKIQFNLQKKPGATNYSKSLYKQVLLKVKTQREIFEYISEKENEYVEQFRADLIGFLQEGNK